MTFNIRDKKIKVVWEQHFPFLCEFRKADGLLAECVGGGGGFYAPSLSAQNMVSAVSLESTVLVLEVTAARSEVSSPCCLSISWDLEPQSAHIVLCVLDTVGFVPFGKATSSWEVCRETVPLGREPDCRTDCDPGCCPCGQTPCPAHL